MCRTVPYRNQSQYVIFVIIMVKRLYIYRTVRYRVVRHHGRYFGGALYGTSSLRGHILAKKVPMSSPDSVCCFRRSFGALGNELYFKVVATAKMYHTSSNASTYKCQKANQYAKAKTTECALLRSCKANSKVRFIIFFMHLMTICFPMVACDPRNHCCAN